MWIDNRSTWNILTSHRYAILPLLITFEKPIEVTRAWEIANREKAKHTAVIIPCYKSASCIGSTLGAALRLFAPGNIFVIANGNSIVPLDETAAICKQFGVKHIWLPVGSKIAALFLGCQAAYRFPFCLLIDDDVSLPDNFPLVTDRIEIGRRYGRRNALTKCIGYALQSVGENGTPGSLCQQAQDLEYKLAGLTRSFFGRFGSATFPHGAISLWEREFLEECFIHHPSFQISEDWFFGLICRSLGGRVKMCSHVFVKTETPRNVIFAGNGIRSGYGEMTVVKQRLWRWNFFLLSRTYHNVGYLLFSWRLRQYEVAAKVSVFEEVCKSLDEAAIWLLTMFKTFRW